MKLSERIDLLAYLGAYLQKGSEELDAMIRQTYFNNRWFIEENTRKAIDFIAINYLDKSKLEQWLSQYEIENTERKTVGLLTGGNIPLSNFHDFLCIFSAGHSAQIKLFEKDKFMIPHFVKIMSEADKRVLDYFEFPDRLSDFDAIITNGEKQKVRYFKTYFGKYPNIIRVAKKGVGLLSGTETNAELKALGEDVFHYFGLSNRSVSKIYVPEDYNFDPLLEAFHEFNELVLNDKYKNNFDYNYTLLILNRVKHKSNGCILLTEDQAVESRIAQVHYEYYRDEADLKSRLSAHESEIECLVGNAFPTLDTIPFGTTMLPPVNNYPNSIDTMKFLTNLPIG